MKIRVECRATVMVDVDVTAKQLRQLDAGKIGLRDIVDETVPYQALATDGEFKFLEWDVTAIGRSWESPQGRRVVVAEKGDRVAIRTGDPSPRSFASMLYELLPKRELDREIVLDENRAASSRKRTSAKEAASTLESRRQGRRQGAVQQVQRRRGGHAR